MLHTKQDINLENLFTNYTHEKLFEELSTNLRKLFEDSKGKFNWGDNKFRRNEFKKRTLRSGEVKSLLGIIKLNIDNERFQEILDLYYSHYDIDSDRTPILRKIGNSIYDFNRKNASVVRVSINKDKIATILGAEKAAEVKEDGTLQFEQNIDEEIKLKITKFHIKKFIT